MLRNGAILIVEDNAIDRELIEMAFRAAGVTAEIRMVENGAEAIAYLSGERRYCDRARHPYPCLILTDLKMPVADGFAVLEFLREHVDLAVIPTIVFSGSADPDDVRTSYRLGASSHIVKPGRPDQLVHCLRTLVDYWTLCEAPAASTTGQHVKTDSHGKLGERFSRDPF
jgi:CheY-like chemotaxis protein